MKTDIVSLLIVISLVQGGLLIALLVFQNGKLANWFLAGIFGFLFWTQLEFLVVRNRILIDFALLFATRLGSWLVLGPLLLLYTKSLLGSEPKYHSKDVLHFVPFAVFTFIIPVSLGQLIPDRAVHYGILSLLKYYQLGTTPLQAFYASLFIFQFIHLFFYLILSRKVISRFSMRLKTQYSNLDKINVLWLIKLNSAFLLVLISVTVFFIILFLLNIYKREFDYLYVLPVTLVIYWAAYKILRSPEIIRMPALANHAYTKYERSSLTEEMSEKYKGLIIDCMQSEKPYLNSDLKLNDLAKKVDIAPHHLSQVLNEQFNLSFFDFINQYRIEEAKSRFRRKNGETILQIAYEVGFNNKASFNNYFKKITNQTPSKFIQDHSN